MSSFASVKGPSITVRFAPENLTRAPFALAWSPSAASSTPAFTSSSLYFAISASCSSVGRTPASESLLALTIIMNRILVPPSGFGGRSRASGGSAPAGPRLYLLVERGRAKSTPQRSLLAGSRRCYVLERLPASGASKRATAPSFLVDLTADSWPESIERPDCGAALEREGPRRHGLAIDQDDGVAIARQPDPDRCVHQVLHVRVDEPLSPLRGVGHGVSVPLREQVHGAAQWPHAPEGRLVPGPEQQAAAQVDGIVRLERLRRRPFRHARPPREVFDPGRPVGAQVLAASCRSLAGLGSRAAARGS